MVRDNLYGDAGIDTVDYSDDHARVTVDLALINTYGGATGAQISADALYDIEIVLGGSGNDNMTSQFERSDIGRQRRQRLRS